MIGRLAGTLLAKHPPQLLIDVNGVGYDVEAPMSTIFNLPDCGANIVLLTHLAVREDGHFLFGFLSESERSAFRQLIKISGIGARTALAVLSGMSVDELAGAIARQESGRLMKVPGIGKKTAERLLLELKDKLQNFSGNAAFVPSGGAAATPDHSADILNALQSLGYNDREAAAAMKPLPAGIGVSDGIRQALKHLSKV
ncbi:MAG TPA: Holliday junction branch migration protein RuvA [Rhodocyclaceae bacterium]|nr:Holliday junction branch migration protein RuvA [Rhodocyclaceae bacterium]